MKALLEINNVDRIFLFCLLKVAKIKTLQNHGYYTLFGLFDAKMNQIGNLVSIF